MIPARFTAVRVLSVALATLLLINLPLPGWLQALSLLLLWGLSFWPLSRADGLLFVAVNVFYSLGDMDAVARGLFHFQRPDLMGLPYWEFGMWGFFVLLLHRMRRPDSTRSNLSIRPFLLIALMPLAFQLTDPWQLTLALYALLGLMLGLDHRRGVLISVGAMIAGATVLEYTCVRTGVWSYPPNYVGGVAYWYAALFGATGYLYETGLRALHHRLALRWT